MTASQGRGCEAGEVRRGIVCVQRRRTEVAPVATGVGLVVGFVTIVVEAIVLAKTPFYGRR